MNARSWQELAFYALAAGGLAGTWVQVGGYFEAGVLGGNIAFWKDTVATPAATFIVVDIFVLSTAVFIWMFGEGRRLGMSGAWLWLYFLGSALIGIACFVPLFLAHRERLIRSHPAERGAPAGADFIAIALTVGLAAAAVLYSLTNTPG